MRRPLALIGDRAYATIWPHVKMTETEMRDKNGNVVKLNQAIVKTAQRLLIVRDDGRVFGDGGDAPSTDLGLNRNTRDWHTGYPTPLMLSVAQRAKSKHAEDWLRRPSTSLRYAQDERENVSLWERECTNLLWFNLDVHLPEIPPTEKLWSTPAMKAYRNGVRPDAADVFQRMVETIDTFIDFDRSLADQRTMCEMIACYILSTWFLDAFTVAGFLWPNGDRGSGKTQLLLVVTELAYLGQTILAGGSFASLRDLADYGACHRFR